MRTLQAEEIKIQLSYGTIAAKWWGSKAKKPIIALHGWQDNAGSFDTLIPLLPSNFSYLAIDFPGHGFSSKLPNGCFYHVNDMVSILEEIRSKYNWKKLSLIGHSMGATIIFLYASLYPNCVELMCAIDIIRAPARVFDNMEFFHMKNLYRLNSGPKDDREFTFNEIIKRMPRSINRDKLEYMMQRGVKPSSNNPNRFQLTCDIRIKYIYPYTIQHDISLQFIKNIQAPYLFFKTDDQIFGGLEKMLPEVLEQFKKYNPCFDMIRVNGSHHAHLNNPEVMAPRMAEFLVKYHVGEDNRADITSKL